MKSNQRLSGSPSPSRDRQAEAPKDRAGEDGVGEDRAARRERRRAKLRQGLDTSVPSPCITVCQVDPQNDCCIGCNRHIDEIRDWPILSADEKRAVLALLPQRKSKRR